MALEKYRLPKTIESQNMSKEVGLDTKTIKNIGDSFREAMMTKQNTLTPTGQTGGGANFSGSMITIFTAETVREAVEYLEDMSAYVPEEFDTGYEGID